MTDPAQMAAAIRAALEQLYIESGDDQSSFVASECLSGFDKAEAAAFRILQNAQNPAKEQQ